MLKGKKIAKVCSGVKEPFTVLYRARIKFIRSNALDNPAASFWTGPLPQKCMKNRRGSSLAR